MTGFLIFIAIVAFIGIAIAVAKAKNKKQETLKQNYDAALRGINKKAALDAGRAYYSSLRADGKLTIYDEQSLTNDLHAMTDIK